MVVYMDNSSVFNREFAHYLCPGGRVPPILRGNRQGSGELRPEIEESLLPFY